MTQLIPYRFVRTQSFASVAAILLAVSSGCTEQPSSLDGDSTATGGTLGATGGAASGGAPIGSTGAAAGIGGSVTTGGVGTGGTPAIHPTCPGDAANAYQATPASIPGTVEAENFDPAGYSDVTEGNEGAAYRTDVDADIKALGAGYAIGWGMAGEWLEYTVNVPTEGDYNVTFNVAAVEGGRTLELSQCGTALTSPINVPQVADWGEVASTTITVHLLAGTQVLRVTVGASDYVDFDSMTFAPSAGGGTGGAAGTGGTLSTGGTSTGGAGTGGTVGTLPKFVGNITTGNVTASSGIDTGGRTFSKYWDQITPENAGKWGSVQGTSESGFNWNALDTIYDYTEDHDIIFKEHVFVWGPQQPTGTITEAHVKTWMQTFCQRYPNTKVIDVVNEPPPHTEPSYANAIGGGTNGSWQWIINAFTWAHQYCPNAILILNDYNNIEYGDQNQHFIDIAKAVKNAGAPIHALGAQAHGLGGVSTNTMKTLLTKMHNDTGLPVYITEYDIDNADDTAQLNKYKEHFPFFMDTDWIHGVTLWGWIQGSTWVPNSGLIKSGTPRPAMTWLMQELGRPAP